MRIILFNGARITFPIRNFFPTVLTKKHSKIDFLITVVPTDDRTDFAQEERLGLPYWIMIQAICVVVDVSICLDISIWEFSKISEHLPLLLECKPIPRLLLALRPGNLEMIYITFAAVICDAEGPCSVDTAQEPESSFTISPQSTTRPLYFWCFLSQSAFLR